MEPIYFTMDELMQEFNSKVIKKGKSPQIDFTKALDLLLHERFNPEHFTLFAGFIRGLKNANGFN
ncbi:hypothetical protein [Spirosoma gilvum]